MRALGHETRGSAESKQGFQDGRRRTITGDAPVTVNPGLANCICSRRTHQSLKSEDACPADVDRPAVSDSAFVVRASHGPNELDLPLCCPALHQMFLLLSLSSYLHFVGIAE